MKKMIVLLSLLAFSSAFAAGSIGELSRDLMAPAAGLAKVFFAISFVTGVGFILGACIQFKYHRENPQQVRLSTCIMLLALGLALIALPFVTMISGASNFVHY